jgi:hypothetical protein
MIAAQLHNEKLAFDELQRCSSTEIRSLHDAARKNFEDEQAKVSQAWELLRAERAQLLQQKTELQRLGLDYEMRDRAESDRITKVLEKERTALESQWVKLREEQGENRKQQLLLENRLADMEMNLQKSEALEKQRNMHEPPF